MRLSVVDLDLNPVAMAAAYDLLRLCPWIVFTSGRRTLARQASAMAKNVAVRRNFISKVYIHGGEELQLVVNRHPEWVTVEQLTHGLYAYLHDEMPPERVAKLSRHMTGDAFDVLPIGDTAQATATIHVIEKLAGLDRFLTREAGLPRWHVQFAPLVVESHQTTET